MRTELDLPGGFFAEGEVQAPRAAHVMREVLPDLVVADALHLLERAGVQCLATEPGEYGEQLVFVGHSERHHAPEDAADARRSAGG